MIIRPIRPYDGKSLTKICEEDELLIQDMMKSYLNKKKRERVFPEIFNLYVRIGVSKYMYILSLYR